MGGAGAQAVRILERYGRQGGDVATFTITKTYSVSQGDIMYLIDPNTVSAAGLGETDKVAVGLAMSDKDGTDDRTTIGVITNCDAELTASGAITLGHAIAAADENRVIQYTTSAAGVFGYALETAADDEVIKVRILPMGRGHSAGAD